MVDAFSISNSSAIARRSFAVSVLRSDRFRRSSDIAYPVSARGDARLLIMGEISNPDGQILPMLISGQGQHEWTSCRCLIRCCSRSILSYKMSDICEYDLEVGTLNSRDNSSSPELSPGEFGNSRRNGRSLKELSKNINSLERRVRRQSGTTVNIGFFIHRPDISCSTVDKQP